MQVAYNKLADQTENVTITDVSGRIIGSEQLKGITGTLDISLTTLETGIYFYKITQGTIVKQTGKFVKQ